MTINFCTEPRDSHNNPSVVYAPYVQFQSADNAVVSACVAVNYRADEAQVATLFEEFRAQGSGDNRPLDTIGRTWLRQRLIDLINEEAAQYTAFQLLPNRVLLLQTVEDRLKEVALAHGLIVEEISWLSPLTYPNEVQAAITQTLTAVQAAERARQDLARAEAQAAVTRTEADAEAYAITVRANAINQNPRVVEYIMAEAYRDRWNGEMPSTYVGGGSGLLMNLTPDSRR